MAVYSVRTAQGSYPWVLHQCPKWLNTTYSQRPTWYAAQAALRDVAEWILGLSILPVPPPRLLHM
jgi:hypothetical protein